jgi:hypothetical protein
MLTSERIAEIQSRSRADYACLDAPGFRDSLAARRDVAALLSNRAELVAEIDRLRGLICEWLAEFPEFIYDADGVTGSLPDPATWFDLITRSTAALEASDAGVKLEGEG